MIRDVFGGTASMVSVPFARRPRVAALGGFNGVGDETNHRPSHRGLHRGHTAGATWACLKITDKITNGIRVPDEAEEQGLDDSPHGEGNVHIGTAFDNRIEASRPTIGLGSDAVLLFFA